MGDGNWIKLNRKICDNFLWDFSKPKYAMAWIDMLMMANYKDKKIMFDGKAEVVQRGSFITSMVKLADRWQMDRKTVKSFLDLLAQEEMITYQATNRRTAIFITKYEEYQAFDDFEAREDGQLTGQLTGQLDGQLTGQLTGHNIKKKELKESKEGKETNIVHFPKAEIDEFFEKVWDLYPVKKGKGQVSEAKRKALYSIGYEELARAVDRYKAGLRRESWRKPQNGGTFFNSGYVDYLDKNYKEDLTNGIYDGHSGDYKETGRIGNYL